MKIIIEKDDQLVYLWMSNDNKTMVYKYKLPPKVRNYLKVPEKDIAPFFNGKYSTDFTNIDQWLAKYHKKEYQLWSDRYGTRRGSKIVSQPTKVKYCPVCGTQLTDSGDCPSCDYGDDNR